MMMLIVLYVTVCSYVLLLCTEMGGGPVDPESLWVYDTPIVDPAPPPVLLTFSTW